MENQERCVPLALENACGKEILSVGKRKLFGATSSVIKSSLKLSTIKRNISGLRTKEICPGSNPSARTEGSPSFFKGERSIKNSSRIGKNVLFHGSAL